MSDLKAKAEQVAQLTKDLNHIAHQGDAMKSPRLAGWALAAEATLRELLMDLSRAEAVTSIWKLQSDDWQTRGWELGTSLDAAEARNQELLEINFRQTHAIELLKADRDAAYAQGQKDGASVEREACAQICQHVVAADPSVVSSVIAACIRARSKES